MKIAISSAGETLAAKIDPRFGRAPYFVVIEERETGDPEVDVISNTAAGAATGAGTEAARLVVQTGAEAVVTGAVGPRAYEIFDKLGIGIYLVGGDLTVEEGVRRYKEGTLQKMTIKRL